MIPDQYEMSDWSGKKIRWGLEVGKFPWLRYICVTAWNLNGRPDFCSTPYFTVEDIRLRKKKRKTKGPLFPNTASIPKKTLMWMERFTHIMQVGEAWAKAHQKESR